LSSYALSFYASGFKNNLQDSIHDPSKTRKAHDLEKMAHYAEMAWTMSDGKVVSEDVVRNDVLRDNQMNG
jgi:hypothetical protein